MNKEKVTVIISINDIRDLKKCLKNLLNQTLYGLEIVCLTNNHTNSSQIEIIRKLTDKDNRIVIKNNIFNIINNAKGDYIYFIDKYHTLEDFALELLYIECNTKKLDIIYFSSDDNLINVNKTVSGIKLLKDVILKTHFPYQLIKKEFIIKSNVLSESFDYDLFSYQLMAKSKKARYLNDILILDVMKENNSKINTSFYYNFKLYITLFNLASNIKLDKETDRIINDVLNKKLNLVVNSYFNESPNISKLNQFEKHLLDLIIKPALLKEELSKNQKLINKYKGQVRFHKSEKESIKDSLSFKIGRIITYIPRKIRNLLENLFGGKND